MQRILPWFGLVLRVYIGGFFVLAAVPKIAEPFIFATSIGHYGLLPTWSVNAFALIIAWLELVTGILLIVGFRVRVSSALTGIMLLMFTTAVAWAVVNDLKIDCGCFGAQGAEEVSWLKVLKNSAMILGCVYLWYRPQSALSLEHGWQGNRP